MRKKAKKTEDSGVSVLEQGVASPPTVQNEVARLPTSHEEALAGQKARFLEVIAKGFSPGAAAFAAGVHYTAPYRWKDADDAFAAAWTEAFQAGTNVFEDEARRRALQGVQQPVYQAGKLVGHRIEYSDNLLLAHLARRSAEWRQTKASIHISADSGSPTQLQTLRDKVALKLASMVGGRIIDVKSE